jgi:hypothetical protein
VQQDPEIQYYVVALNITLRNEILQFEDEPSRRKITKVIASITGASMFALKIIFQQQLDLPRLPLAMLVLVR